MAIYLGTNVYQDLNCLYAWCEFSASQLLEVLNTVRNRILDFSIAIGKENPTAGEDSISDSLIKPTKVTQIFETTVLGGYANVIGTTQESHINIEVRSNDLSSLEKHLQEIKVPKRSIAELKEILNNESHPTTSERVGPRVNHWIAKMVTKAAEGSWKVSIAVASKLLADAISKFYGF